MTEKTITISAEWDDPGYAWEKDSSVDFPIAGARIGDLDSDGIAGYVVSEGLVREFEQWLRYFLAGFGEGYDWLGTEPPALDWEGFNDQGVELARHLKREIGGRPRVCYVKAWEDPTCEVDEHLEVLESGIVPLPVRVREPYRHPGMFPTWREYAARFGYDDFDKFVIDYRIVVSELLEASADFDLDPDETADWTSRIGLVQIAMMGDQLPEDLLLEIYGPEAVEYVRKKKQEEEGEREGEES